MSLNSFIVILVVFWLLVHLRHRQILSVRARNNSLLPLTNARVRSTQSLINLGHLLKVDLASFLILRLSTSVFVGTHTRLVETLRHGLPANYRPRGNNEYRNKWAWKNTIKVFYDIGSVTAVIGQIIGFGGLSWCLLQLFFQYKNYQTTVIPNISKWKRSTLSVDSASNNVFLKPLIPGVTLPISHAFPIFLSMMMCTAIHELGHALAAIADGIPLLSWGYSLIIIIPAAFVELSGSSNTSKDHSPSSRLRISAAGAFHNLLTLFVLYLASYFSFGRVFWGMLGYREVWEGAVVVDVSKDSPLQPFLPPGSIVTFLDDMPLMKTPNASVQSIWDAFLLTDTAAVNTKGQSETRRGWCVERSWFDVHPTSCCPHNPTLASTSSPITSGSCFIPYSGSDRGHCINPVPLFENRTVQRCTSDAACNTNARDIGVCIRPHLSSSLLRISVIENINKADKVVVWNGPRREIWEQVTIGTYLPKFFLSTIGLPTAGTLLFIYLKTVSVSLFFFNILPIRNLDGGEILGSCMDMFIIWKTGGENVVFSDVDLERVESPGWRGSLGQGAVWSRRARRFEIWIERLTIVLVALVVLGGAVVTGVG